MTKTTLQPETEIRPDAAPVVPPAMPLTNGHEPSTETPDTIPAPLLRGQQRPSPIGPPIPNHPLAPLAGKYADEPLWDEFQEAIRAYRQRINEQEEQEDDNTPALLLPGQQSPLPVRESNPNPPLAPLAGAVSDEALLEAWQEAVIEYRKRIDEQEANAE